MTTRRPIVPRRIARLAGGAYALFAAMPAAAQTTDVEALRALVARQATMIQDLQQRVSTLEAQNGRAVTAPSPQVATPTVTTAPPAPLAKPLSAINVDWSQGSPIFRLPNGTSFHVRGRLYVDASSTSGSRFASRNLSGTELSSARLGVDGTIGTHWGYKVEVEFADGRTVLKDNYVAYYGELFRRELLVFVGNKTGDRTIDGATYDDFVPFFQRSMLATSIGPEKGIMGVGMLAKLAGDDWHLGVQIAGDDPNGNAGTASDTISYIGRATWTPKIATATRIHVGAWAYYEDISNRGVTSLVRAVYPGEHFNDNLVITMTPIDSPRSSTGEGGEIGFITGPFWAFGEYGRRHIVALSGDRVWTSSNIQAGVFLTGEPVNFSPAFGSWQALRPLHSIFDGGRGAIELITRYEKADLGRSDIAGSGHELTVGADWYLSRNLRVIADWVHWKVGNPIAPYIGMDSGNTFNLRFDTSF